MLISFVLSVLLTVSGVVMLVLMMVRDDSILGVFGFMALNVAGMFGAAYGVLSSA
ncbi:hypothetical protein GCM10023321_09650 [Pseudonocardia eucalypti]|uniref:Uncharacterized protein n=1 Tax=Pseudonocardia eucalypti TaxID=648755 RepID=A0ABP9PK39_9PSEU|nr:hypothetical protein [Pseudonocardia eucalypti]